MILDPDQMAELGKEDGFFEYLTFLFFASSGFLFLKTYFRNKNIWFLLLTILFLFGAGEEISWGQRIFSFTNPEFIEEVNVQNEFNIHNIEFFNTNRFDGSKKSDLSLLFTINFLYKLFWLSFAIILPLLVFFSAKIKQLTRKIRLPIPPFAIGIFFLINWLVSRLFIFQE